MPVKLWVRGSVESYALVHFEILAQPLTVGKIENRF
jgi:hypothetical protein